MNILGISAYYHDSAAALLRSGRIIAAAQEERFTRKKHDERFPRNAIHYCLAEANVRVHELDSIVFYDKPILKFERLLDTYLSYAPRGFHSFVMAVPVWLKEKLYLKRTLRQELASLPIGLPAADRAGIEVNEVVARIVTDTAHLEIEGRLAQMGQLYAGDPHIHRLPQGVVAVFGDPTAALALLAIGGRGAIARDELNFPLAAQLVLQQKQLIEQLPVDVEHFVAAIVAEDMVELRQTIVQITAILPIAGVDPLAGIEVEEAEFTPCGTAARHGRERQQAGPHQATGPQQQTASAYLLFQHPLSVHSRVK